MDCPQLTEKRLRKTRNVDFHRGKLAISEIYCKLIFSRGVYEGGGGVVSHLPGGKFYRKYHSYSPEYVCICEGEL